MFDLNGTGHINKDDFISAYERVYPNLEKEDLIAKATKQFEQMDIDGDGEINFSEWNIATIDMHSLMKDKNIV